MPFPTANAAEAPTFPTATAAEAQVRSLVSGDASAPVGVADLQAATRALGELVRSNLRPLARAADGRLLFVAAPASENEVTSRCLRLLALVWSKPPFRTMLHHRHLAEELGALITIAGSSGSFHARSRTGGPEAVASAQEAAGAAASGAAGRLGSEPRAASDWARERLAELLEREAPLPLLEALLAVLRARDGAAGDVAAGQGKAVGQAAGQAAGHAAAGQAAGHAAAGQAGHAAAGHAAAGRAGQGAAAELRRATAALLSQAVLREGGAQALLLCLREGAAREGGECGAPPPAAIASRLLSTPPRSTPLADYYRGMCCQVPLPTPTLGRPSLGCASQTPQPILSFTGPRPPRRSGGGRRRRRR